MKQPMLVSLTFGLFVCLLYGTFFTVKDYEEALLIELGRVEPQPITKAGLHWKLPLLQEVKYFDRRIQGWEGERGEVPTKDKKFIWVDATARWRIANSLVFYRSVRDIETALARMGPILEAATKDTISSFNLIESVRNSNRMMQDIAENLSEAKNLREHDTTDTSLDELTTDAELVTHGREKLSALIADRAREELKQMGITLFDVQLRGIAYQAAVEKKVYESMVAERLQIATKIRSAGRGEEAKILGQLDLALKGIESQAYRKAEARKGQADSTAMSIYAEALKGDPQYYEFIKTLETYKKTIPAKGEFILSTDNAFLQLLRKGA